MTSLLYVICLYINTNPLVLQQSSISDMKIVPSAMILSLLADHGICSVCFSGYEIFSTSGY